MEIDDFLKDPVKNLEKFLEMKPQDLEKALQYLNTLLQLALNEKQDELKKKQGEKP